MPAHFLTIALCAAFCSVASSVRAGDKEKAVAKPTVVFFDLPDNADAKYTITIHVELDGTKRKLDVAMEIVGGLTSPVQARGLKGCVLDEYPECRCTADGKTLVIEGWKDSETGKFHHVKTIRIDTVGFPKECRPVVKLPPRV